MHAFGETDWGRRWLRACAIPRDSRAAKGESYARSGAVVELKVEPGKVSASVQGSRRRPYAVTITTPPLAAEVLAEAMARRGLSLRRLYGHAAQDDWRILGAAVGLRLFPMAHEPEFHCSCPDWGLPCKHGAAVALTFARALDEVPARWLAYRFAGQPPLTVVGGGADAGASGAGEGAAARGRRGGAAGGPARYTLAPAAVPVIAGPTAAEVWGGVPGAPPPIAGAVAAAEAAVAPGSEPPLLRLTAPPRWGPDDPDLDSVLREMVSALAGVAAGDEDIDGEITAAFATTAAAAGPAAAHPASGPAAVLPAARRRRARRGGDPGSGAHGTASARVGHPRGAPPTTPLPPAARGHAVRTETPSAACPACRTPVDSAWLFCVRCGRRLRHPG